MSDARANAVERLAWLLDVIGSTDDNPEWAFDEWPAPEWDCLSDLRRAPQREMAERIMRTLGLVAVPPELVERVRVEDRLDAEARRDFGTAAMSTGGSKARLALADAVLAQLTFR